MTTTIKTCFKCGVEKPLASFPKRKTSSDGYRKDCKSCVAVFQKAYRKTVAYAASTLKYIQSEKGKAVNAAGKARRKAKHPLKHTAHCKVTYAIRAGKLIKEPCRDCGDINVHGHHPDYSKPLDVIWLCPTHHIKEHSKMELKCTP